MKSAIVLSLNVGDLWRVGLGRESGGCEGSEFGKVEDVMDFPRRRQFDAVGDVTDLFHNFEWSMAFVVEFARRGFCFESFGVKEDKGAGEEGRAITMVLVVRFFHGRVGECKSS